MITDTLHTTINEVMTHRSDRSWWADRVRDHIVGPIHTGLATWQGTTDVMSQDWDTLIVLDGCRADAFESILQTDRFDSYTHMNSPGSTTPEWASRTFNAEYPDTVYVSGNPLVAKHAGGCFHDLIDLSDSAFDTSLGTVHPDDVYQAALTAYETYPNKRLIVHFMQPHHPFIADRENPLHPTTFTEYANPWEAYRHDAVTGNVLWNGYTQNLEFAASYAFRVATDIPGKAVITADHGNLMGEHLPVIPIRAYGHPPRVIHDHLRRVPWGELDDERRTITPGTTSQTSVTDNVDQKLRQLGYKA